MGISSIMARHLRQPTGVVGKMIGRVMNTANGDMNLVSIGSLDTKPDHRVLEIGFGNGRFLPHVVNQVKDGFVAGIDYSQTMVVDATKRHQSLIREGKLEIQHGVSSDLPYPDHHFDHVFTVNTIYFWPQPLGDLQEIKRVLKAGGKVLISYSPKDVMERLKFTQYSFNLYSVEEVERMLTTAGFSAVRSDAHNDSKKPFVCTTAVKP